ncbi:hypothetical protein PRJ_2081 [Pseudomonas sp. XWY-1]|nr:hypothetical protein PRJ_2081 [Pseudomonas sp. XWY-1]
MGNSNPARRHCMATDVRVASREVGRRAHGPPALPLREALGR